jgi:hypothetical protein
MYTSLRPFRGRDVRRLLAFSTLALAFPFLSGFSSGAVIMDHAFVPVAVSLLLTQRRREQLIGRLVALFSCLLYIFFAVQSFPSYTFLMYAVLLYASIGEAIFLEDTR